MKFNKEIINNLINENYKTNIIFEEEIQFYMDCILNESGGISPVVVKETNRLINNVSNNLTYSTYKSLNN